MGKGLNYKYSFIFRLILWASAGLVLHSSCRHTVDSSRVDINKKEINAAVAKQYNPDSLAILYDQFEKAENRYGMIAVCREQGKRYREKARFSEALSTHRKGLLIATEALDTVEIMQAHNNIGTDLRRMGLLSEAIDAHYMALDLSEQYARGGSGRGQKEYVVALNGIGNIHKTLDNRDEAESFFRRAIEVENSTGNNLGLAINWANLGSIYKFREQYDSAYTYYARSLEYNEKANSKLGIALCHTHFGQIHECLDEYDKAFEEYQTSYKLLKAIPDKWNWLKSCNALASMYFRRNDLPNMKKTLDEAVVTAHEINSFGHLETIYHLYSDYYEKQKYYPEALQYKNLSIQYRDSLVKAQDESNVYEARVRYEREQKIREISELNRQKEEEAARKRMVITTSAITLLLTFCLLVFLLYLLRIRGRTHRAMQQLGQMRTNFFTNITHEFRTPLTVILGLVEQLEKEKIGKDEQEKYLSAMKRQGISLLGLVNQLLDMSKIMLKSDRPQWQTGDVVAYIRMMMESYHEYAHTRRINLVFAPEKMSIPMDFVPEYFNKILRNLLSNALKFTPKEGIIRVSLSQKNNLFIMQVEDSGKGISPTDLPLIFDTFYQGESYRVEGGTGIGLSYVRQLTESMGGTVTAENKKTGGALFTLKLPLKQKFPVDTVWHSERSNEAFNYLSTEEQADSREEITEQRSTILIIEDNEDISLYIGSLLKDQYRLIYASNGEEGLEKAKEYIPDLIITDLMMPGKDGYELCREVRTSYILNHIPIIIITAKAEDTARVQGLDAGADAYLQKPFRADELMVRVSKLLEQRRLLRKKFSQALVSGIQPEEELNPVEQEFLNNLTNYIHGKIADANLSSNMVADRMCMSLSQLNRKLKSIIGFNSSGYIIHIRMEKAKRLLSSSEEAISNIAMKCGFEDAGYFTRVFKQYYKITPTQYRKRS